MWHRGVEAESIRSGGGLIDYVSEGYENSKIFFRNCRERGRLDSMVICQDPFLYQYLTGSNPSSGLSK